MNYKVKYDEINNLVNDCNSSLQELLSAVEDLSNNHDRLLDGQRSDEFIPVIQNQMQDLSSGLNEVCSGSFTELLSNIKVISDSFEATDEELK
jgi:uncharacterized protein YukE